MTTAFIEPPDNIPPQLSRSDLSRLTPEQTVQAHEAGQLEVVLGGRDPLPFERNGERRATPAEAAQAIADQAEAQRSQTTILEKQP